MKARIIKIGDFDEDGQPVGWIFDGGGATVAAIAIEDSGVFFGGYSVDELRGIKEKWETATHFEDIPSEAMHSYENAIDTRPPEKNGPIPS